MLQGCTSGETNTWLEAVTDEQYAAAAAVLPQS